MTPDAFAALHALAFTDVPRSWSAAEFADLLRLPSVILAATPEGFAIGRLAGPEVELLTLAVHPSARRRGLGATLVTEYERGAATRGAVESLLEVADTNVAARRLYARLGYTEVGHRRAYYQRTSLPPIDALVLRKSLA